MIKGLQMAHENACDVMEWSSGCRSSQKRHPRAP